MSAHGRAAPALPPFEVAEYARLLSRLAGAGYRLGPVSEMPADDGGMAAYLRHDIDAHLYRVDELARAEADAGARATYYVALTQPYNVLSRESGRVLRSLIDMGHELGLHYDLECYPAGEGERRAHLDWEISVLERAAGCAVRSLCMHQPFRGEPDPFRELDGLVHPHDPRLQQDLVYVSDSCRAWRDTSLLRALGGDPPRRLLLNTHPEVWLDGSIGDRGRYLDEVLIPNGTHEAREYYSREMREIWTTHAAARQHDLREAHGDREE